MVLLLASCFLPLWTVERPCLQPNFKIDCAATPRQPAEHDIVWKHIAQTSGSTIATLPRDLHSKLLSQARYFLSESTPLDMTPPWSYPANASGCMPPWVMFLNVFLSQLKMRSKTLKAYQGDGWKAGAVLRWREKERQRCSFTMQPADIWAFILASIREPALRFTKTWPTR